MGSRPATRTSSHEVELVTRRSGRRRRRSPSDARGRQRWLLGRALAVAERRQAIWASGATSVDGRPARSVVEDLTKDLERLYMQLGGARADLIAELRRRGWATEFAKGDPAQKVAR